MVQLIVSISSTFIVNQSIVDYAQESLERPILENTKRHRALQDHLEHVVCLSAKYRQPAIRN